MACSAFSLILILAPCCIAQKGSCLDGECAASWIQTQIALQTHVRGTALHGGHATTQSWNPSDIETAPDMNGRLCHLCTMPPPKRSDREYVQRTDCGNQSIYEHPENWDKAIVQFNRPAEEGHNASTAFCELNYQKMCADAIYNRDWLFQAKAVDIRRSYGTDYDPYYCYYNGWLSPELKALQHDFDGMDMKARRFCESHGDAWQTMTMREADVIYWRGYNRSGLPTREEALLMAEWNCAMGTVACDMAYCAYSFCELANGSIGTYDDCEGWDPVQGMPAPVLAA
ncbi:unnamed protein product [Symbiodinium sp. CCMP2592]|nr:unnamed protein product [Symbiodinium sp. CCMP2592]